MNKKIIITGGSGSGKDYLMNKMIENGFKSCIKTTTIPIRNGEIQNKTYHFITNEEFKNSLDDFLTYESFEVTPKGKPKEIWYYGITKEEFENCNVAILTTTEIKKIKKYNYDWVIYYLNIDRDIRKERIMKRKDNNDSIERRLDADELDFKDFNCYDKMIKDPNFKVQDIINYDNLCE